jgi:KaiC/GvpD/RAD55 family RecA-like ATPase
MRVWILAGYSIFGSTDIDHLLGEDLPAGSSYLLESETGTQEPAFVASFLDAGFNQQELCIIATYDMPHQELMKRLPNYLHAEEKINSGSLLVLDLWTEVAGDPEFAKPIWTTHHPRDINTVKRLTYELAHVIPDRIRSANLKGIRYVTQSLSLMTMNYKFQPTYQWMDRGLNRARRSNTTALTLLDSRMVDGTVVSAFEHIHDAVITLSMRELGNRFQRSIRIKKSPNPRFSTIMLPYDIVDMKPQLQKQPDNAINHEDR